MHFTNKTKHWVLQHYLWIATGLFGLSLFAVITFASGWNGEVKFTIVGVPFAFVVLVQKQKLEETHLFKELFNEFNARYDSMNEDLNRIRTDNDSIGTLPADRDVLYNYFNLCAEEYFFYSQGYIPEDVWRSWREGMTTFFASPRIWKVWGTDPGGGSYYGFVPPRPSPNTPSARAHEFGIPASERREQRAA